MFDDMTNFSMAGKTGTAEESTDHPNHGLFIGYAPYDEPEIAIAVRIVNGYASSNAASVAKDIINYRYNLKDKSEIITGTATQVTAGHSNAD